MSNIAELVRRAQAGDLGYYEEIVARFRASAFGRAFARLGDSHLAKDSVQEAFVEAHRNLGSLTAPKAFPTWFQKVVATACDRMTRRKTLLIGPLSDASKTPE